MSAAVDTHYSDEDDFEDDFESESASSPESTPPRAARAAIPTTATSAAVADPHHSPASSRPTSTSTESTHSSASSPSQVSASVAAAAAEAAAILSAPPQHAVEEVAHRASLQSGALHRSHSTSSSSSSSSSSLSSADNHAAASVSRSTTDAVAAGAAGGGGGGGAGEHAYPEEEKENWQDDGDAAAYADEGPRRADGSRAESRTRGPSTVSGSGRGKRGGAAAQSRRSDHRGPRQSPSSTTGGASGRRRVQRPDVPQDAEELAEMQAANATMRDVLFEKSREHYHAALSQGAKAGGHGTTMTSTATAGSTGHGGNGVASVAHRDAVARVVRESLNAHRTVQALRLEQRDLTQRRDELKKLIGQYRRAAKYRELVEGVKQDINDYQEEHRDVQLEVRCNEKLLLLAEHMAESGIGDRRVQEEIRAQNALTQRRREHALRDADAAQRKRDAAAQRVEELKAEVKSRRENTSGGKSAVTSDLLAANKAKKDRIRELRTQMQEAEAAAKEEAAVQQRNRSQQSVKDDAERDYLRGRIAELHRELKAMTEGSHAAQTGTPATAGQQQQQQQQQSSARASPPPVQPSSPSVGSRSAHSPAEPAAAPATVEFDVSAWLNNHPANGGAPTDPAETLRTPSELNHHHQHNSGEHVRTSAEKEHDEHRRSNADTHAYPQQDAAPAVHQSNVYIPPVPEPPYAQEPAAEVMLLPVSSAAVAVSDTPAWLGGGMEEAAPVVAAANTSHHSAPAAEVAHNGQEEEEEYYEGEDVVEDEGDEMEELDEPSSHAEHTGEAATPEAKDDADGPDWLNF